MRIVQVCATYSPNVGGIETHVREISERLVKRGFDISVLTTDPSGKLSRVENINGVQVSRFNSWAPNEAYYFSGELKRHLIKNSNTCDIIHAHSYHGLPALYAAQAKGRNKFVFTPHYHGAGHTLFRSLLHMPYKFLAKRIFEKADRTICVSQYEKNLIKKNFDLNEENVIVIPNGVNLEEFRILKKRKKNHRIILYVGRLEKYKGVQHSIRVMPKLDHNMILEIVGKGPYKGNLVKLSRKLGVDDRVKFFHDLLRTELLQKYVDADVLVLLSKHEAYSISVAEALCARTPCIVANTSALSEWIDEHNCFGIDYPIDLEELKNLISSVIGNVVGKLKIHDWNEVADRIVSLYEYC